MNRQQPTTIDLNHENSQMTKEQWLAVCKEAALKIDPETAEVRWDYARTLDPYGIGDAPDEYFQVGRAYFARSPGSDVWVWFGDLPDTTRAALWEKHQSRLAFPAGLIPFELFPEEIEELLAEYVAASPDKQGQGAQAGVDGFAKLSPDTEKSKILEHSMTLRFSSELADDEGRVFLAYAPPRKLMVMGRRDPRNGDLCVSRYIRKLPEVPWPGPDAPCERITGPEAERLLDAVERWIASQQN